MAKCTAKNRTIYFQVRGQGHCMPWVMDPVTSVVVFIR